MTVRRLFSAIFGVSLLAMATREPVDPDLWWHLRTGATIARDGLPRTDPFSFTRAGTAWVAHEWLADLFLWFSFEAGGLIALSLLFAFLITVTFWLLFLRCAGRPYLAAFVVLLAALASAPTWGARPQIFNLLLAALLIYLVEGYLEGAWRGRRLLFLLPLTVLWANLHSGYLFGIVLLAGYTAGTSLTQLFRANRDWSQPRLLGTLAVGSLLAALVNPQGMTLWFYPFSTLSSTAMQQLIAEWRSPDFHLTLFWPFAAMLFLIGLSWLYGRRRVTWTEALFFFGGAAAGLISARNIPLFAVANTVMLSRHLISAFEDRPGASILRGRVSSRPTPLLLQGLNLIVLLLFSLSAAVWMGQRLANIDTLQNQLFPVDAATYLAETGLAEGRGFNSYAWGGFLIWRDIEVFVDGRADIYEDFLFTYQQTAQGRPNWADPLAEYDIDYVLIEPGSPLASILRESPDWRTQYEDSVAVIFVPTGTG